MLILGIDTGGTYTDGVVLSRETRSVIKKAKALTTPDDLAEGLGNCLKALDFQDWNQIGLVCLSTTLATNAVVEGRRCPVGLLLLGGRPEGRLPAVCCQSVSAQLDLRGNVKRPLDEIELEQALSSMEGRCEALAVSGYGSTRNPDHELQAAKRAEQRLKIPVVCAHQLTDTLGFYERTVTAALNAGLIPMIKNLIESVRLVLDRMGVPAPVMIVKGDGSLISADYAVNRPVETILSGPAASVTGACFLSGLEDCMVLDMGGTTTDTATLKRGRCAVTPEGAQIAGWRTRVRAMKISSHGLGGDSRIFLGRDGEIEIGPKRVLPLCREAGLMNDRETCLTNNRNQEAGLTPTDILHTTGEYIRWNQEPAREGLRALARQVGKGAEALERNLEERILTMLWDCCLKEEGDFDGTLVGVGAPAHTWLKKLETVSPARVEIPLHFEVANAVGAAAGQICQRSEALIRRNRVSGEYCAYTEKGRLLFKGLDEAKTSALKAIREFAEEKAEDSGAACVVLEEFVKDILDCRGDFVECRLAAEALGYPKA